MSALLQLVAAIVFPVGCLFLLLWLTHLEDTLPESVRHTERRPDPPPILAFPVRAPAPVFVPQQRQAPSYDELVPQTPLVSRSAAVSLGGSTNL